MAKKHLQRFHESSGSSSRYSSDARIGRKPFVAAIQAALYCNHGIHSYNCSSFINLLFKKIIAAGLTFCLVFLTSLPAAAQENQSSTVANSPPHLPSPTPTQSLKARGLFEKGAAAFKNGKSKDAQKYFGEAHKLDPENGAYLTAYEIARQQLVGGILQQASEDEKSGDTAVARKKLMAALAADPANPYVREHLESIATKQESAVLSSTPMPRFSSGLIELQPKAVRATFHLHANARQIVKRVLLAYGVTALLDDSVPTSQEQFDLDNATFAQASTALQLATNTFLVPLDGQHALVAKDSPQNRHRLERMLLETVFLPGVDSKEMSNCVNVVRNVFEVRQVSVKADNGTLTIRAPEATLRAVNATLSRLYLPKPNVVLDVRIYQVTQNRQQTLGVSFPQTFSVFNVTSELNKLISANQDVVNQLIASGLVNPGDLAAIAALLIGLGLANGTILSQPFALFGNGLTLSGLAFGPATGNASLNISNTRELDHVQLRTSDLQTQSFLVGSRYPVITQSYSAGTQAPTSFTSLASLLSGQTQNNLSTTNPLAIAPTVQYQDLGLTMKAKTEVLQDNNVRIQLQIKIAALAGAFVNGSPIINNRSFTTAVNVPDGGSALLTSNLSRTESRSLSGIPGLSELPGFGWTASPTTQVNVGKLLIVISPHIVSATHPRVAGQMLFLPRQTAEQ